MSAANYSRWTIFPLTNGVQSGPEIDFRSAGFGKLRRSRSNQQAATVTFDALRGPSQLHAYPDKSSVMIRKDGVAWFYGRVTASPDSGTGLHEGTTYQLADPFWYLEHCTFQQIWMISVTTGAVTTLVPTYKSRIIFGQQLTADGYQKMSIDEQITEILNYAISVGAPFQVGDVIPDMTVPYEEAKDPSCAEALQMELRFAPDAVHVVDMTTMDPANPARYLPTLHFRQRAQCPVVTRGVSDTPTGTEYSVTKRTDLNVPSVCLKYEQVNTNDGQITTAVTVDVYPTTATGQEFESLVATIELSGSNATHQRQQLTTESIDAGTFAWWQKKLKYLSGTTITQAQDDTGAPIPFMVDGSNHITAVEGLTPAGVPQPYEIVSGALPKWLAGSGNPCHVVATANYRYTDPTTNNYRHFINVPLACNVNGTDLATNEYATLTSFTEAEAIPTGLAQALYEILSVPQYQGFYVYKDWECDGAFDIGTNFNLSGDLAAWTTMNAQVQQIAEDVDAGETRITFGPAAHLGVDDFVALLRVNRGREITWRLQERATGQASGPAQVDGDAGAANESSSTGQTPDIKITKDNSGNPLSGQMLPGQLLLRDNQDNTRVEMTTDSSKVTIKIFDNAGAQNRIDYDSSTGKLVVSNATSGKTATVGAGLIGITDSDGSFLNLTKNTLDMLDGATGKQLNVSISSAHNSVLSIQQALDCTGKTFDYIGSAAS